MSFDTSTYFVIFKQILRNFFPRINSLKIYFYVPIIMFSLIVYLQAPEALMLYNTFLSRDAQHPLSMPVSMRPQINRLDKMIKNANAPTTSGKIYNTCTVHIANIQRNSVKTYFACSTKTFHSYLFSYLSSNSCILFSFCKRLCNGCFGESAS